MVLVYDAMQLTPEFLRSFAECMQAFGHADMDCLRLVDFSGCKTVVDLGGMLSSIETMTP